MFLEKNLETPIMVVWRPMEFFPRDVMHRGTSHGPVSLRLSVTSRCSIETSERIELILACELPSICPTLY